MASKDDLRLQAELGLIVDAATTARAMKSISTAINKMAKDSAKGVGESITDSIKAQSKAITALAGVQLALVERKANEIIARGRAAADKMKAEAKLIDAKSLADIRPQRVAAANARTGVLADANTVQMAKIDARAEAQAREHQQELLLIQRRGQERMASFVSSANERIRVDNNKWNNKILAQDNKGDQDRLTAAKKADERIRAVDASGHQQRLTLNQRLNNSLSLLRKRFDLTGARDAQRHGDTLAEIDRRTNARRAAIILSGEMNIAQRRVGQETVQIAGRQAEDLVRTKRKEIIDVQHENRIAEINQRSHNAKIQSLFDGFKSSYLISFQNWLNRRRDRLQSSLRQEEEDQKASLRRQQAAIDAQNRISSGGLGAISGRGIGGGVAIGGTLAGIGLSGASLSATAESFDTNMKVLQATLGLSEDQMKRVSDAAVALGQDMSLPGVSSADAVAAFKQLVFSGLDLDSVLGGAAKSSLLLSRVLEVDQVTAIKGVSAALNVFGVKAGNTTQAVDTFFNGLLRSGRPEEVESFINAIARGGSNFAQFGRQTQDSDATLRNFVATIAILNRQGVSGERAGTGLSRFVDQARISFGELTDKDKELAKPFFDAIGRDVSVLYDANGKARTYQDSIRVLQKGLNAYTNESDKAAFITSIFGTEADDTVRALGNLTKAQIDGIGSMEGFASAAEIAAKQNDNIKGAIDGLVAIIETKYTAATKAARERTKDLILEFAKFTDKLLNGKGAYEVARLAIRGIALAATGLSALKVGIELLGLMKPVLAALLTPMGLFAIGVLGVGAALAIFPKQRAQVVGALKDIGEAGRQAFLSFTAAFKDPTGGITSSGFNGLVERLGIGARGVFDKIAADARSMGGAVKGVLSEIGRVFTGDFSLTGFEAALGAFIIKIKNSNIAGAIAAAVRAGVEAAPKVLSGGIKLGTALAQTIADGFSKAVGLINFGKIFSVVQNGLRNATRSIAKFITSTVLSEPFLKAAIGLAAVVGITAVNIGIGLVEGIVQGIDKRKGDIAKVLKEVLSFAFKALLDFGTSGPLQLLATALVGVFVGAKVLGAISSFVSAGVKGFKTVGIAGQTALGQIDTVTAKRKLEALEAPADRVRRSLDNMGKSGKFVGLAADFQGLASKSKNVYDSMNGIQGITTTLAVSIGAFFSGKAIASDGLQNKILGLAGAATSIATAFAAGGPIGAGIAAVAAGAGVLFGWLDKGKSKAAELLDEVKRLADVKIGGASDIEVFTDAIKGAIVASPGFGVILDDLKVTIPQIFGLFQSGKLTIKSSLAEIALEISPGMKAIQDRMKTAGVDLSIALEQALDPKVEFGFLSPDQNRLLDEVALVVSKLKETGTGVAGALQVAAQNTRLIGDNMPASGGSAATGFSKIKEEIVKGRDALRDILDDSLTLGNLKIDTEAFKAQFETDMKTINEQLFGPDAVIQFFAVGADGKASIITSEGKTAIISEFKNIFNEVQAEAKQGIDPVAAFAGFKEQYLASLKIPEDQKKIISDQIDSLFGDQVLKLRAVATIDQINVDQAALNAAKAKIADAKDRALTQPTAKEKALLGPPSPYLPRNAFGSIITKPTTIFAGEDGPEVVIPLTKPQRARQLAAQSGLADVIGSPGRGSTFNIVQNIHSSEPRVAAAESARALRSAQKRLAN